MDISSADQQITPPRKKPAIHKTPPSALSGENGHPYTSCYGRNPADYPEKMTHVFIPDSPIFTPYASSFSFPRLGSSSEKKKKLPRSREKLKKSIITAPQKVVTTENNLRLLQSDHPTTPLKAHAQIPMLLQDSAQKNTSGSLFLATNSLSSTALDPQWTQKLSFEKLPSTSSLPTLSQTLDSDQPESIDRYLTKNDGISYKAPVFLSQKYPQVTWPTIVDQIRTTTPIIIHEIPSAKKLGRKKLKPIMKQSAKEAVLSFIEKNPQYRSHFFSIDDHKSGNFDWNHIVGYAQMPHVNTDRPTNLVSASASINSNTRFYEQFSRYFLKQWSYEVSLHAEYLVFPETSVLYQASYVWTYKNPRTNRQISVNFQEYSCEHLKRHVYMRSDFLQFAHFVTNYLNKGAPLLVEMKNPSLMDSSLLQNLDERENQEPLDNINSRDTESIDIEKESQPLLFKSLVTSFSKNTLQESGQPLHHTPR